MHAAYVRPGGVDRVGGWIMFRTDLSVQWTVKTLKIHTDADMAVLVQVLFYSCHHGGVDIGLTLHMP